MPWIGSAPHRCAPPTDHLSTDKPSGPFYWICDVCGDQYRVDVGRDGARSVGPNNEFIAWSTSYQKVSR